MADEKNDTPDIENRDRGLHRHGEPDPKQWDEAEAVTGRPVDEAPENTTFGDRAKAREKAVKSAENKAVDGDESKDAPKRTTRRTTKKAD